MATTNATSVQAQVPPQRQQATLDSARTLLQARGRKGASWFYWIAGLSVVNSIIMLSGSKTHFVVGLGITTILDVMGQHINGTGGAIAMAFTLMIAGVFALFGYFAHKLQPWAFVVGMILYGLDALLLLSASDFLGVAFHAFALYCLFAGLNATRKWAGLNPANAPLG